MSKKHYFNLLVAFVSIPLWGVQTSSDNAPRRTIEAKDIGTERIRLDGILDEAVWESVSPATGFIQEDPKEGAPSTETSEVYVLYDKDNLYIGARLYDSDPSGILAYQKRRDASLRTDDRFMWILDTFLDGRTGYFFEINPAGLMGDGILGAGGHWNVNKSWDGIWDARVQITEEGWSAEIEIPFRTLNFDPELDSWGINFQRTIRRKNEDARWTGFKRNQNLTEAIHAGTVSGLRGISHGKGFEVTPYGIVKRQQSSNGVPESLNDAGLDLSFNVTSGLRGSFTYNTDFAEAEVDERRVNLTRFPLRFREKRAFFLEGSGVYTFANRSGVTPFFSRRIGISEGSQIPITYGGRLTGQVGNYEIGMIRAQTESVDSVPAENFNVARVKKSLFRESYLGLVYTGRSADADSVYRDQDLIGVDLDLSTSQFRGDKNLEFQTFFVGHTSPKEAPNASLGDLSTRGIRLNYPNDLWQAHVSYREFGEEFDPAVGFNSRNGFKRLQPSVYYRPRPENSALIRQMHFGVRFEYMTDMSNQLLKRQTTVEIFQLNFESADRISAQVVNTKEYLDHNFEIIEGNIISMGNYVTNGFKISGETSERRKVALDLSLSSAEFWTGNKQTVKGDLSLKPFPGVNLKGDFEYNSVSLADGGFDAQVYRLTVGIYPTPRTAFYSNVQYDDVSNLLGLFAKLRHTIRPGSDLYIVYTHNWQSLGESLFDRELETLSKVSSVKLNYTHRF
ncbi:MAG: DUF5916 domain-containing protein [Candidatus Neomarinimicrobiota bacterium]|nr:DUF5916 domain-containing protein [Candidatus Neomarinimicrobiota bacterium]